MKKGFLLLILTLLLPLSFIGCERTFGITLEATQGTGYEWSYVATGTGEVKEVRTSIKRTLGVGGKSTYTFDFKGVKEGDVTLSFFYARSFEDENPEETRTLFLEVDSRGNIREKASQEAKVPCVIALDSNPSTGYLWEYTMSEAGVVKEIAQEYQPDSTDKNLDGGGGKDYYIFEGIKPGEVTLTFTYARPWEVEETPDQRVEKTILVDAAGNAELID